MLKLLQFVKYASELTICKSYTNGKTGNTAGSGKVVTFSVWLQTVTTNRRTTPRSQSLNTTIHLNVKQDAGDHMTMNGLTTQSLKQRQVYITPTTFKNPTHSDASVPMIKIR